MNDPHLPADPGQPVVMVVDDDLFIVHIARIALEYEGHFVITAEDGEEAIQLSRKFPGPIHVLVTDVVMPRMNGLELRDRLIVERPGTKVVLMTGQVNSTIANCPVLRKPFQIDDLRERVRQLLDSGASGKPTRCIPTLEAVRASISKSKEELKVCNLGSTSGNIPAPDDAMDDALRTKVNEAWEQYRKNRTPENHAGFAHSVKVFSDWVLWRKLHENPK